MKILKNKIHLNYRSFIILISLIPCILILSLSYAIICNMQVKKTYQDAETKLEKISTNINILFNHAQLSASSIASSTTVAGILSTDYGDDIKEKIEAHNLLSLYLSNYKNANAEHEEILIFHNNPSIYDSRFTKQIFSASSQIQKLYEKTENTWIYNDDEKEFHLYVKSSGYNDSHQFMIQYTIFMHEIDECINNVVLKGSPYSFVFSPKTEDMKNHITKEISLLNGSRILCHIPKNIISDIYIDNGLYFLLVLALISATITLFATVFSNSVNKRLSVFLKSLEKNNVVTENAITYPSGSDELLPIYQKIFSLLKENHDIEQRAAKLNSIKTSLELELIQMKINPHLLYNTLAAFRWEIMDLNPQYSEAIEALAGYYRKVLHNGEYIITFKDELELISDYIAILSFTHEKDYKITYDIPKEILGMHTIKLILQPFIENAVLHGLAKTVSPSIVIRAYTDDKQNIKIEITDNGAGIPEESLKLINEDNYGSSMYKSYGIQNTKRRINLYYGSNSNIVVRSRPGEGTTVLITLEHTNRDGLKEKFEFLNN